MLLSTLIKFNKRLFIMLRLCMCLVRTFERRCGDDGGCDVSLFRTRLCVITLRFSVMRKHEIQ
jgi:hypothetical protein